MGTKEGWHVLWLGAGFSRDFGLPLFTDFLQHTELLYSYEGLIPPIKRKTLDGKMMTVPLADAKRKEQPTDKEDKDALEIVLDFRESCSLPQKDEYNLEKIFMEADNRNDDTAKKAIMRVVVRTFDLALGYRYRDWSHWCRVYSSENIFWGSYPILNPWQRKRVYERFFEILGKLKGNVAIITVNWDAAIFEFLSQLWIEEIEIIETYKGYDTVSLPGYIYDMERVHLKKTLECGYGLSPKSCRRFLYLPLHGAVNLLSCPYCSKTGKAVVAGGVVHNYKYRKNYNKFGWSKNLSLSKDGDEWFHMVCKEHCYCCKPLPLEPVLSPPSEKQKVKEHAILRYIWEKADTIMSKISSIHFIGASFPVTDIEVKRFIGDKLNKIDKNNKCAPISVTSPEAYDSLKDWRGYSLIKKFRCIETRYNLQHFITDPPFPFN